MHSKLCTVIPMCKGDKSEDGRPRSVRNASHALRHGGYVVFRHFAQYLFFSTSDTHANQTLQYASSSTSPGVWYGFCTSRIVL